MEYEAGVVITLKQWQHNINALIKKKGFAKLEVKLVTAIDKIAINNLNLFLLTIHQCPCKDYERMDHKPVS